MRSCDFSQTFLVLVVTVLDDDFFFVTSSSLEVCATLAATRKTVLLNVCKMTALQCMGKKHVIAEDGICKWPERNTTGCTNCHMWETCDGRDVQGHKLSIMTYSICNMSPHLLFFFFFFKFLLDQTNQCRCKDSADCLNAGLNVCVRVGEDATAENQTMSECEAGLQRCKGEKVSVVSILPCTAWGRRRRIWPYDPPSHTLILYNTACNFLVQLIVKVQCDACIKPSCQTISRRGINGSNHGTFLFIILLFYSIYI